MPVFLSKQGVTTHNFEKARRLPGRAGKPEVDGFFELIRFLTAPPRRLLVSITPLVPNTVA